MKKYIRALLNLPPNQALSMRLRIARRLTTKPAPPQEGGVYLMVSGTTGEHYVGGSIDYEGRWRKHIWEICNRLHLYNQEFRQAYKDCTLAFFVLQKFPPGTTRFEIDLWEQYWTEL